MSETVCEVTVFEVPAEAAGQRLDAWLAGAASGTTRSQIKLAAQAGRLRIDDKAVRASHRLRGGERVCLQAAAAVTGEGQAEPQDIEIDVLYADESLVAVNKPPGMVVHPATGNRSGTLVNAILHHYPSSALPGTPDRAGIVHRLDRDTSGVILVALTVEAHEALSRQFRARTVGKSYLALVRGNVKAAGEIDLPLGRHPRDRKRMSTASRRARSASTAFEPVESFGRATLLLVRPKTGRTHQIRVHLAARGWPIVADPVYGRGSGDRGPRGSAGARRIETALATMPRQALHAAAIRVAHPVSGRPLLVEAPLAADFGRLLGRLRETKVVD